jgi:hypothetical protein
VSSAAALLAEVARFGLNEHTTSLASRPVTGGAWRSLLAGAQRGRLVGLLQAAVDAGALPVTEQQRVELAEQHLRWCVTSLDLERELLTVTARLASAGIGSVVLKGAAHAHLLYPDPAWRTFGDNDLLVLGEDVRRAIDVLADLGYERSVAGLRPSFDRRFGKGATLRRDGGPELDLHRTLLFGTYGLLIEPADLFDRAIPFELGGQPLRALGPEDRLLHTCIHSALGDPEPRLASLRDVAQAAEARVDDDTFLSRVDEWRSAVVVLRVVYLLESVLGVEPPRLLRAAAERTVPTTRDRRAVAAYVGRNRSFAAKARASLSFLPSVRDRTAFLLAAALPAAPLRVRFGGRYRWYLRALRGAGSDPPR